MRLAFGFRIGPAVARSARTGVARMFDGLGDVSLTGSENEYDSSKQRE